MALDHIPPNPKLSRELEEVAKEAARVDDTLRGVNLMPRTFPSEAINEICISLGNLKNGTAEGCHEPLNFARYMLPLVRRDHFHIEGEEPEAEDDEDTYFTRDHPLDQAILRLYGAVGTALDEYRAQAQDRYDDHVGAEETLEFANDGSFAEIDQKSRETASQAERERENLADIAVQGSTNAEKLGRQLQDGANIAHSVRSQLRIRPVVARWYESARKAVSKIPDVLDATADAMHVGTDIAQIWIEKWSGVKKRIRHLAYDTMRDLAEGLRETAQKLRKRKSDPPKALEQRDPGVVAAEREALQLLITGKDLPNEIARKVEQLEFPKGSSKLQRPWQLARLVNAKKLSFANKSVVSEDFEFLRGLVHLSRLVVKLNDTTDISALGKLPNLTSLSVTANSATDISALGQLQNLTSLSVQANSAADISALGQLQNLTSLSVPTTIATDISAIGQLQNLTSLSVNAIGATDISAIGQLQNLTNLSVQANSATDISALGQLQNLTSLTVNANSATDISALGQLLKLTTLKLDQTDGDLAYLKNLRELRDLQISNAKRLDLAPLANLIELKKLRLANVSYTNLQLRQNVEVEIVGESFKF